MNDSNARQRKQQRQNAAGRTSCIKRYVPEFPFVPFVNVRTGGDPNDDEYPEGDDDDNNNSNGEPTLSGDELPKIQNACERCQQLEWVEACHLPRQLGPKCLELESTEENIRKNTLGLGNYEYL
ncbi:hypothetical protein EV360DRAFT_67537 [Lentinula raphanica]|nr:hypothetical protein EV360DRAFT_67537 [Lentinula raphanica]